MMLAAGSDLRKGLAGCHSVGGFAWFLWIVWHSLHGSDSWPDLSKAFLRSVNELQCLG
jgi:hypothetical protein